MNPPVVSRRPAVGLARRAVAAGAWRWVDAFALVLAAAAFASASVQARLTYPDKPVKVLVPYGAGGSAALEEKRAPRFEAR